MTDLRHYMIHCPGWIYAVDEWAKNRATAIAQIKQKMEWSQMPTGYACWRV